MSEMATIMSHNKVFIGIILLVICGCSWFRKDNASLPSLFEDMKHYRTTSAHRGDLWQHSIWTSQILGRWTRNVGDPLLHDVIEILVKPLSPRDCYLVEVAGLVHDIGKAGDLDITKYEKTTRQGDLIYYFSRDNHERIGFEYIIHDLPSMQSKISRRYQKIDGEYINFYNLFTRMGISEEEQKVIAILVGSHKTFSLELSKPFEQLLKNTIATINSLAAEIHYIPENFNKLLAMVVLVQIADAYATFFSITTPGPSSLFDNDLVVSAPHPSHDKLIEQMLVKLLPQVKQFIKTITNVENKN